MEIEEQITYHFVRPPGHIGRAEAVQLLLRLSFSGLLTEITKACYQTGAEN